MYPPGLFTHRYHPKWTQGENATTPLSHNSAFFHSFKKKHQSGKLWHEMTRTWTCVKSTPHGKGVFTKDDLTLRGALWTPPHKSRDTQVTRNDTHRFIKKSLLESAGQFLDLCFKHGTGPQILEEKVVRSFNILYFILHHLHHQCTHLFFNTAFQLQVFI